MSAYPEKDDGDLAGGPFSFLGGPLHATGVRVGLIWGGWNSAPMGFAFGVPLWCVMAGLAAIDGDADHLFTLSAVGAHVRLLLVIPLLFFCESLLAPRMAAFVATIVRSGVVPRAELPEFKGVITGAARLRDAPVAEAACIVAAMLLPVVAPWMHLSGQTTLFNPADAAAGMSDLWYDLVCMTVFRFLVFRWLWRLAVWTYILWRLARLDLWLSPIHPDRAGGLGYLDVVQFHFLPLVAGISIIQAAGLAEEFAAKSAPFESIYPAFAIVMVLGAALVLGPPLVLTPKLWSCRVAGISEYGELASRYVGDFERKWMRPNSEAEEPLLGTASIQSLADLSTSVGIVRDMRVATISLRLLVGLFVASLAPILPLLLFAYPAADLLQRLIARVVGL